MRRLLVIVILLVIVGCEWSPSRDNVVDPASPYYEAPHQANRPPSFVPLRMITDGQEIVLENFWAFEVHCRIFDADNNLQFDSVNVSVDTLLLGPMSYDPLNGRFTMRRTQNEVPRDDLSQFVGKHIVVSAVDDSGAAVRDSVEFHNLVDSWPEVVHPKGEPSSPAIVTEYLPVLGWEPWLWDPSGNFSFSVKVFFQETGLVWDTSGLSFSDTTVTMTDSLIDNSLQLGYVYNWFLTVTDQFGNRMTAVPEYFYLRAPQMRQEEITSIE